MRAQPNAGTQLTGEQTENGEGRRDGGAERCGSEMSGSEDNGGSGEAVSGGSRR